MKTIVILKDPVQAYRFLQHLKTSTPKPTLRQRLLNYEKRFIADPLRHGLIYFLTTTILLAPIYLILLN